MIKMTDSDKVYIVTSNFGEEINSVFINKENAEKRLDDLINQCMNSTEVDGLFADIKDRAFDYCQAKFSIKKYVRGI